MKSPLIALGLAAFALGVQPAHALRMADDAAGPTCEHYSPMGPLAWQRRGGDWLDATGRLHGTMPIAVATVRESPSRQRAEWELGAWLSAALARKEAGVTVMLRAAPGVTSGQVDFHSRESPIPLARPALELLWRDGQRERLTAVADTYLDCTSAYSLGQQAVISVRGDRSSLLHFRLPVASQRSLQSALLVLASDRQAGGGMVIAAYEAMLPYERAPAAVKRGLASAFVLDEGISAHPQVWFASGFDTPLWQLAWRDSALRSQAEAVSRDPELSFVPLQGRALRVRILKGQQLGLDLRYLFARHGHAEPDEAYLRYYLRFANDWEPTTDGGKLPGFAGTYGRAGWGNRMSDGKNGWSMRAAFAMRPPKAESMKGYTALFSLACHGRVRDVYCDSWGWGLGNGALLQANRWYAIEQRVKLNTPGKADGVFEAWLDGVLVRQDDRIIFRDLDSLHIESAWFDVFHGGAKAAAKDMTLYIDGVVIARSYIGPMGGVLAERPGAQGTSR